jgi:prokaryotic ubiquitin-like protein Pup
MTLTGDDNVGTDGGSKMEKKDTGGQRQTTRRAEETEETEAGTTGEVRERQEKLSDDVDAILDEIDEVLEENAEEFVRSYVQKGGQ